MVTLSIASAAGPAHAAQTAAELEKIEAKSHELENRFPLRGTAPRHPGEPPRNHPIPRERTTIALQSNEGGLDLVAILENGDVVKISNVDMMPPYGYGRVKP